MADERRKLIKAGGLWLKKSGGAAGTYLTGKIGMLPEGVELRPGMRMFVFANKKMTKENSPTHILMVEDPRDPNDGNYAETHKVKPPDRGGFEDFGGGDPDNGAPF